MKLLLITRKINNRDSRVGFFSHWIDAFAKEVESLIVITWQESSSELLPHNVRLISLSGSTFRKIYSLKMMLVKHRRAYDKVFIHMNPEYALVAAPVARLLGKRVSFWYTHKSVTIRRRLAELFVNNIFTASDKSFRKPFFKKKVHIVGHGIAVSKFHSVHSITMRNPYSMITVGRISTTKDIETMIQAIRMLRKQGIKDASLVIVGAPAVSEDASYLLALQQMVKSMELELVVTFRGPVPYDMLPEEYQAASIYINLSHTGSLDKAILEAMISGCIVITSNEAVKDIIDPRFFVEENNDEMLVKAIAEAAALSENEKLALTSAYIREVEEHHSLQALIKKMLTRI